MADKYTAYELLAKAGGKFIDDAALHTGPFKAVQCINAAIVDVSDCTFGAGMIDFDADFTIPAGAVIYGDFDVFSLTSGSAIAYYA